MVIFKYAKAPGDQAWYSVASPERIASINSVTVATNVTATNLTVGTPLIADDGFQLEFLASGGTDGALYVIWLDYVTGGGSRLVRPIGLNVATPSLTTAD